MPPHPPLPHLLVARDASIDGSVDDAVETHAEQVDVAMHLLVLVLADQGPQLLVLVLHNLDGILQGAHLHLGTQDMVSSQALEAASRLAPVDGTPGPSGTEKGKSTRAEVRERRALPPCEWETGSALPRGGDLTERRCNSPSEKVPEAGLRSSPIAAWLTSSRLSTSNHREMPGKLWVRVSVVRSIHRLYGEGTGRDRPLGHTRLPEG